MPLVHPEYDEDDEAAGLSAVSPMGTMHLATEVVWAEFGTSTMLIIENCLIVCYVLPKFVSLYGALKADKRTVGDSKIICRGFDFARWNQWERVECRTAPSVALYHKCTSQNGVAYNSVTGSSFLR